MCDSVHAGMDIADADLGSCWERASGAWTGLEGGKGDEDRTG